MHHDVDYKGRPDRDATLDFVKWMGFKTSYLLAKYVKYKKDLSRDQFHLMCSFRGVQGKPVDTFMDHFKRK